MCDPGRLAACWVSGLGSHCTWRSRHLYKLCCLSSSSNIHSYACIHMHANACCCCLLKSVMFETQPTTHSMLQAALYYADPLAQHSGTLHPAAFSASQVFPPLPRAAP